MRPALTAQRTSTTEYIGGVLSKLSRFFTVVRHKETTIYAPPTSGCSKNDGDVTNTVWSIIVKRESEKVLL